MIGLRPAIGASLAGAVAVVTTIFTTGAVPVPGKATPIRPAAHATVLGYVESGDGLSALRRSLAALTNVGVDGVNISATGAGVSSPDQNAETMLAATHSVGKSAELLVGNFNNAKGDFDPVAAHLLFISAQHRRDVIAGLVTQARHGWNGIQLDFESLNGSDRAGLSRFTSELRAALPTRTTLSMAVMASTSAAGYRDNAYDLPVLARQLTRVVLMAYDQHGPTWTTAGPVGGLPWVELAMATMLKSVPRNKVVLGVAGYGYTWPAHRAGTQLSDAASRRSATSPVWNATQAEWNSPLRGGGSIWWSDARSLQVRRALSRRLGVQGVAVWSLGLSDPLSSSAQVGPNLRRERLQSTTP
ncbi:glycosyl hydrolase family 18 protein [Allobranchiibius sp. GilTou38]|uniref:glycosyl hydrolase family 18 protein n=1 Tax=Allobranchiibius sp. GilTou38 TaxID=2815210 RepID=UPI001AA1739E|nr:hydrolase [Allobranchiibius sp. GilTou38]